MTRRLSTGILVAIMVLLTAPAAFAQTTMQRAGNPSFTSVTQMNTSLVMAISFQDMAKAKAGNFSLITYYSGGSISATTTRDSRSLNALNTNPAKVTRPVPAPGTYTATALINDADGKTFWEATKSFTIAGGAGDAGGPTFTSVEKKDTNIVMMISFKDMAKAKAGNLTLITYYSGGKATELETRISRSLSALNTNPATVTHAAPEAGTYTATALINNADSKTLWEQTKSFTIEGAAKGGTPGTTPGTPTMALGSITAKDAMITIPVTASNLATGDKVNVWYVNTKTSAKSSVKTLTASQLISGSGTLTWTGAPKDTSYDVTATLVDAAGKTLNTTSGKVTLDAAGNSTAASGDPPPGGTTGPTQKCTPNGKRDHGEECDPQMTIGNASCIENGDKGKYSGGNITCVAATCTFDFGACVLAKDDGTTPGGDPADPADPTDPTSGDQSGESGDSGGGDASPALPINQILISTSPLNNTGQVEASGLSAIIRRITTAKGLVGILLAFVLSFLGIVALMMLVISGFRYVTAFGGDTAGAKKAIGNVIIGIIVILGAWAIVTTVINFGAGPAM